MRLSQFMTKKDKVWPLLVGYVRRAWWAGKPVVKICINKAALAECESYTTADGQEYIAIVADESQCLRVTNGLRAVTTVQQYQEIPPLAADDEMVEGEEE